MPEWPGAHAHFAPEPETVAAARRFVRDCLSALDPDLVHEAIFLVGEVAANVVDHARTDYEVRVAVADGLVRVEVADGSSVVPAVRALAADAERGRGLHLIAAIAQAWGVEETSTGKHVWFELASRRP